MRAGSDADLRAAWPDQFGDGDREVSYRGSQADFLRGVEGFGIAGLEGGKGDSGPVAGSFAQPTVGSVVPGVLVEFLALGGGIALSSPECYPAGVMKCRARWW